MVYCSNLIVELLGSHFLFLFVGDGATVTHGFTFSVIAGFFVVDCIHILISRYDYLQFFLFHVTLASFLMPDTDSLLALGYFVSL